MIDLVKLREKHIINDFRKYCNDTKIPRKALISLRLLMFLVSAIIIFNY